MTRSFPSGRHTMWAAGIPHLSLTRREIETWLPVLAAARLAEGVPEEDERLLRIVESM